MDKKLKGILVLISLAFGFLNVMVLAQNAKTDIYNYNLMDLAKNKVKTATKLNQEYQNVPFTIKMITEEDIRENAFFTLEDALASLPGFQFRNIQGFNSYTFQRGIPNQNNLMLVLIDGVQVNELNSGGFYGGAQFNLDHVERIEVLYGPSSVFYGTNAISGVVNIITKEQKGVSASLQVGEFNTKAAFLSGGLVKNDWMISFSGMYKGSEKANLKGAAGDYNWSDDMENFEDDFSFDVKMKYKNLKAACNFMNKQASRTTLHPSVNTAYMDRGSLWNILFANVYLSYSRQFKEDAQFEIKFYNRNATVAKNTIGDAIDTTLIGYYRPNHLVGVDAVFEYSKFKNLDFIAGFTSELENLASGFSKTYSNSFNEQPPAPTKPNMIQNNLLSGVLNAQYTLFKKISIVGGLRYDISSYYNEVFTPQIALLYNQKNLMLKLRYGSAYRAPKPWDLTDGLGNPELLPEKLMSFELSSDYLWSKSFRTTLNIYRNNQYNSLRKRYTEQQEYYWDNWGEMSVFGIEASAKYSNKTLDIDCNYTYTNSLNEDKNNVPEISKHTAFLGFKYRMDFPFIFSLQTIYIGERESYSNTQEFLKIDPAVVVNAVLNFNYFKNLYIQVIGRNLFNQEYYHSSNTSVIRYRQPQRNIHLKLTYHL